MTEFNCCTGWTIEATRTLMHSDGCGVRARKLAGMTEDEAREDWLAAEALRMDRADLRAALGTEP